MSSTISIPLLPQAIPGFVNQPYREETVAWTLKAVAADKPWAIVAIPDSNLTAHQELSGTPHVLPQIA